MHLDYFISVRKNTNEIKKISTYQNCMLKEKWLWRVIQQVYEYKADWMKMTTARALQ
jgi:hypothetical protein